MRKFLRLLVLVLLTNLLQATSITSTKCGAWTDPTTWNLNRIPQSTDTVIVNSFVSFDTDFSSASPGMLNVTVCGTLCGSHSYTGQFLFNGVIYMYTITCNYGHSASYSTLNVQQMVTVINPGTSYSSYGSTCVGCTSHCQNCSTSNRSDSLGCAQNSIASFARQNIIVYPNPASGKVILSGESYLGEIILINSMGSEVLRKNCPDSRLQIEINELPPGLYVISVRGRQFKLVKN